MKSLDKICFVCLGTNFKEVLKKRYLSCTKCGHQTILAEEKQYYIINDILELKRIKKDFLFFFKKRVTLKCSQNNELLVDIGSGSGQFIYFLKDYFRKIKGIEVTEEAYKFSKHILKLDIHTDIKEVKENISVATFWHSLEHIPSKEIEKIFEHLYFHMDKNSKVIISVPNSKSIQALFFKDRYAYFDYPNHIHQFSWDSLVMLMEKMNFVVEREFYSFYYILFGYIQGLLNFFNPIHNFFYYRKKRKTKFPLSRHFCVFLEIYNIALILFFLAPSLALTLIELFLKKRRGVITICFKKKNV